MSTDVYIPNIWAQAPLLGQISWSTKGHVNGSNLEGTSLILSGGSGAAKPGVTTVVTRGKAVGRTQRWRRVRPMGQKMMGRKEH